MPYSAAAQKTRAAMNRQYGSGLGDRIFYALANKRAGKGLRGKHRGHLAANAAYAKGKKWGGKGKRKARRGSSRKIGHRVTVRTRGRASVSHRSGGVHVRIRT